MTDWAIETIVVEEVRTTFYVEADSADEAKAKLLQAIKDGTAWEQFATKDTLLGSDEPAIECVRRAGQIAGTL